MGWTIEDDDGRGYSRLRLMGAVTAEELIEISTSLAAEDAPRRLLVDLAEVDFGKVSFQMLRTVAERRAELKRRAEVTVAIVADGDLAYGLARIWTSLLVGPRAFRCADDAIAWLVSEARRHSNPGATTDEMDAVEAPEPGEPTSSEER